LAAQKALAGTDDGIWFSRSELSGLAEATLFSFKTVRADDGDETKDQFWVPFHGPALVKIMQDAHQSKTRQKWFVASKRRFPENVKRLQNIIILRQEAAVLLGFDNHASLRMEEKMAESIADVDSMLQDIREKVEPFSKKETERLLQLKKQDIRCSSPAIQPDIDDLSVLYAWDWGFYAKQLRQEKYSVDATKLSEYFEARNTFNEMLRIFEKLFSIEFVGIQTSVWHESVSAYAAWDSSEEGGGFLGYLYVDLFARDGKYRNAQHIPINRVCRATP
jgi:metallopeptidase MepB